MILAVVFHSGASLELGEVLAQHDFKRIALVTGGGSFEGSGAAQRILPQLGGLVVSRHQLTRANPTAEDVAEAVADIKAGYPQAIVAVGGGSVLDLAKIVSVCLASDAEIGSILVGSASPESIEVPVLAVPTTSGSGAEMTAFATVYVDRVKYSVAHPRMRPVAVLLDPELTYSMPPHLTAVTGLDALSHAIESIWSVRSVPESVESARLALELTWAHLPTAVHRPDPESRERMAEAANLAGKAINISRTTACHALSYRLTSHFGVPHGHAAALTLGVMLGFNAAVDYEDVVDARGADHVRAAVEMIIASLGVDSAAAAGQALTAFIHQLDLATRLHQLGVPASELPALSRSANFERLGNNPRYLDEERALQLLVKVA